jgi:hypothetical protein
MFTRRSFLSRAILATVAFLGCSFALPAQGVDHMVVARWDGLLTQAPVYIDWWDMVPGDIVRFADGEVRQVEDLPRYGNSGIPCVELS